MFEVTGTLYIEDKVEASTEQEAALAFKDTHGVLPQTVGGRAVVGQCEACRVIIFDGDKYGSDEDGGELICEDCFENSANPVDEQADGFPELLP